MGTEAEIRYAFADAMRMLTNRINIFVRLPMKSLDQLTLQKQLDAIGKTKETRHSNPCSIGRLAGFLNHAIPHSLTPIERG